MTETLTRAPRRTGLNVPRDSVRAITLGLLGSVLVAIAAAVDEIRHLNVAGTLLGLLALAIGSWPGLAACGRLADAYLAMVRPERRQGILEDRYVGTYGASAIILGLIIELVAAMTTPPARLVALPVSAALAGSGGALIGLHGRSAPGLATAGGIALVAQVLLSYLLGVSWVVVVGLTGSALLVALAGARTHLPSHLLVPFSSQVALMVALFIVML